MNTENLITSRRQFLSATGETVSLKDMISDYLRHFKLHLAEIEELIQKF
jgi:DNA-directed RNA polymerase delta subunit